MWYFLVSRNTPFLLSIKMLCKTASCPFYLSSSLFLLLSLWLSLVAGLFLLSPAMMAPHLAVGTMRNDKMGEPCFYLMGQNQTTVCSQKSVPIHSPCHIFPFSFIHPSFQLIPTWVLLCVCVCARVSLHSVHALCLVIAWNKLCLINFCESVYVQTLPLH